MADNIAKVETNNSPDDEDVSSSKFIEVLVHFFEYINDIKYQRE